MKPTIKDIARKAGVSIATVSFVINNTKPISEETKSRVIDTIEAMNYHPSKSARSLATGSTGNIGFILTDDHFLRTEPFYTRIFLGTEFEARAEGYYILLTSINPKFSDIDPLPRFILNKNVDGLIIAGKIPGTLITQLAHYNLPTVFIDYIPAEKKYPLVLIDNIQGGLIATKHLLELGHKNIAFISGDIDHPSLSDRLNGYKQALLNNQMPIKNNLVCTNNSYPDRQNGFQLTKKLFKSNKDITAVFAGNDAMAIGAMHFLREAGYRIPDDISVVGFDDIEADLMLEPPLTTVRVPKVELGAEALRLIVNNLKNKKTVVKKILIPVDLIVRNSTTTFKLKKTQ